MSCEALKALKEAAESLEAATRWLDSVKFHNAANSTRGKAENARAAIRDHEGHECCHTHADNGGQGIPVAKLTEEPS